MVNNRLPRSVNWSRRARNRWRWARWIHGTGAFALLAHCGVLTVTLHETLAEAEKDKALIDRSACGGRCHKDHEIVDLQNASRARLLRTTR